MKPDQSWERLTRLFSTIREYTLDRLRAQNPLAFERFAAPLQAIGPGSHRTLAAAEPPAVLSHLPATLTSVPRPGQKIVAALAAIEAALPWMPVYRDTGWSRGFARLLAVCEIAGSSGPIPATDTALGLMLCGPDLAYPRHAHPAAEIYVALNDGGAVERHADGRWRDLPAGAVSYHPSDTSHAFRTGDSPVLVAYAWQGEISEPTWWKRDMTDPDEPRRRADRIV